MFIQNSVCGVLAAAQFQYHRICGGFAMAEFQYHGISGGFDHPIPVVFWVSGAYAYPIWRAILRVLNPLGFLDKGNVIVGLVEGSMILPLYVTCPSFCALQQALLYERLNFRLRAGSWLRTFNSCSPQCFSVCKELPLPFGSLPPPMWFNLEPSHRKAWQRRWFEARTLPRNWDRNGCSA